VERVCSGIGIPDIYKFLRDDENILERQEIAQLIASAKNHAKAIVEAAFDPHYLSELCRATVDLLVSILASEGREPCAESSGDGRSVLGWRHCSSYRDPVADTALRGDLQQKRPLQRFDGADADSHHHNTGGSSRNRHIRTAEPE
jgi:hypothetical protein